MWIINLLILVCMMLFYVFTKGKYNDLTNDMNSKEHPFRCLYSTCFFIQCLFNKWFLTKTEAREDAQIRLISVVSNERLQHIKHIYQCKRLSITLFIIFISNLFSLFYFMKQDSSLDTSYLIIHRNSHGKGDISKEFNVTQEDYLSQTVTLPISEQIYSKEEAKSKFNEASIYLQKNMVGENLSLDQVNRPLNLMNSIPQSAISVEWFSKKSSLIESDGTIHNSQVPKEGIVTEITAILTYGEEKIEEVFPIRIIPNVLSKVETEIQDLMNNLTVLETETREEPVLKVPKKYKDFNLSFQENKQLNGFFILPFGVLFGILFYIREKENLNIKIKDRNKQLIKDYPELISKLVLFLGAGLTIKGSLIRITKDYQQKKEQGICKERYLYEELLWTCYELQAGVSEKKAYSNFGKRMKLLPYQKLTTQLTQNLVKGSGALLILLRQEEKESFESRKELAKRLGEEASTKLLFPMMLLLGVVLVLVMFPALFSFRM